MVENQSEKKKITEEFLDENGNKDANVDSDTQNMDQSQKEPDHVVKTFILVGLWITKTNILIQNHSVASNGPTTCLPSLGDG
jgi:hypothetical protein